MNSITLKIANLTAKDFIKLGEDNRVLVRALTYFFATINKSILMASTNSKLVNLFGCQKSV
jgi:hypothetical protein